MFYLTNALFIGSFFSILAMAVVTGRRLDVITCPGVRVEHLDNKNALSNRPPYNSLAKMSELALSLMSADASASVSSLIGRSVSYTDTS